MMVQTNLVPVANVSWLCNGNIQQREFFAGDEMLRKLFIDISKDNDTGLNHESLGNLMYNQVQANLEQLDFCGFSWGHKYHEKITVFYAWGTKNSDSPE